MSQYPLIPYDRVRDHFQDQLHILVSAGSVFNFNVAMNEIGILPVFKGVLCHDHWKPYYLSPTSG